MLKPQAKHSHSKFLLSWRGMQAWCLGRRASRLCRFFIRIRTRPRLRLASILLATRRRNHQASFLKWLVHTKPPGTTPLCCFPIMKEGQATCQDHLSGVFPLQLHQKPFKEDVDVRSQAGVFKRVHESPTKPLHTAELCTRLGSGESSLMSCLQRQSSTGEISLNSLSLSSSASSRSSSSASSSSHRGSGSKLKEACAKVVHGGPSVCELVVGNQFLMHLSAAPITATLPHSSNGGLGNGGNPIKKDQKAELNPSMGLPSLRHKESDLNDRIVFFK